MQFVFFWQDKDINGSDAVRVLCAAMAEQRYNWHRCSACFVCSDARRVFYSRTTISMVAKQCVFCKFWQDIDFNCSDAVRDDLLWQDNDIKCSDAMHVFYGRTKISMVAMQCVFFV